MLISAFILLVLYRYLWSLTPSWFIDSVATLYISETYSLPEAKVGLISSKYIPQPNGMIIFGHTPREWKRRAKEHKWFIGALIISFVLGGIII